jgi:hypothetical protein
MTDASDQDWERVSIKMTQHDTAEAAATAAQSAAATKSTRPAPVTTATTPGELTARTLKITVVLQPADVLAIPVRDGQSHVQVTIRGHARTLRAQLNAKGVRRAQAAIREAGLDGVAVVLQAKLTAGDLLEEAGLSAQPKGPRP